MSSASEADIIFNRASVALAKSQRLIASWLPPRTAEEIAHTKSEEELEKEDREIFAPVPELLGIGATAPTDSVNGILKRKDLSADDKLRKQLLGKDALKQRSNAAPAKLGAPTLHKSVSKPLAAARPRLVQEESEDEEGGRASAFQSRKTKVVKTLASEPKNHSTPSASAASAKRSHPEPDSGEDEKDSDKLARKKENIVKVQDDVPSAVDNSVVSRDIENSLAEQPRRKKKKKKNKHKENQREVDGA